MFKSRPLQLPPQLEWKYMKEPTLAQWSLRARPYNTDVANGLGVFFFITFLAISAWVGLWIDEYFGPWWAALWASLFFAIVMSGGLSMTHQKTNFAYRLTASGLEFCEWKVFPDWIPRLLKWLAIITGVGMLALATIHPAAVLGAIVGPGLLGLMYLNMATSSSFREMHEIYRHKFQPWGEFTKMTVFRRRSIIGLDFSWYNEDADEGVEKMRDSIREVYCSKAGFDDLVEIVKAQLPESTPYTEAYIPIYA